jgi:hypothetical protein
MSTLTKTGVEFDTFRFWRQVERDPETQEETTRWHLSVEYRVLTQEGESWRRDATIELTGAMKTRVANLLPDVRNWVLSQEGIA